MVVGDVVSGISNVLTGANFDFQPASGVEVLLKHAGGLDFEIYMYNGTIQSYIVAHVGGKTSGVNYSQGAVAESSYYARAAALTNTIYLRANNSNVGTQVFSYSGYQTK